jgi:hypothetical protein
MKAIVNRLRRLENLAVPADQPLKRFWKPGDAAWETITHRLNILQAGSTAAVPAPTISCAPVNLTRSSVNPFHLEILRPNSCR